MKLFARAVALASLSLALGCQTEPFKGLVDRLRPGSPPPPAPAAPPVQSTAIESEVLARAQMERTEFLEREVERLHADLQQAERSIVELESGLRDLHTRADAVSAVAEARVALDRVSKSVPWQRQRVAEARAKLEEADRQLASDHLGAAVFFASRAQRITESLQTENDQVAKWDVRCVVRGDRVNLRSGPSPDAKVVGVLASEMPLYPERELPDWTLVRTPEGRIGWVNKALLK
jgi:SH3 domain-containing protein